MNFKYKIHLNDLPTETSLKNATTIAIDGEFSGLNPLTDKLHLLQLCDGSKYVHLVRFKSMYSSPNLKNILENKKIEKIFHFGRADLAFLKHKLKINVQNIFDTKIASKICRKFTSNHGLKDLAKDLINIKLDKEMQTSDWGKENYTEEQIKYAANDVLHLHNIKSELEKILKREGMERLSKKCFEFLETRTDLDLKGLGDIFEH
jgi:ribonuclease D